MRLLLFDIDGTLIHKGGMGSAALRRALWELYGIEDALAGMRLDGKTDLQIVRELFSRHSLPWSENTVNGVLDTYLAVLDEEARLRPRGQLCPGVPALLEVLAARRDCVLGLLTGNVIRGAEIKLRAFRIWDHFQCGAFGSDREQRNDLVQVALSRARDLVGRFVPPCNTVIVGDTPADIEAARHGNCVSVAVATGRYSVADLDEFCPDHVLSDLACLPEALAAFGFFPPPISEEP